MPIIPSSHRTRKAYPCAICKTYLVDIGHAALTRGDWNTVRLITILIQGGGLRHA
jgi:hypothetical protein